MSGLTLRLAQAALILVTSLPAIAPANALCPGGTAPADASHPSPAAARFFGRIARTLRVPDAVGQSSRIERYCVTCNAVFYSPTWLRARHLHGPPSEVVGFAALAYIAGIQTKLLSSPTEFADVDVDLTGAHAAGCALARVGVRGDNVSLMSRELERLTGPRDDSMSGPWQASFSAGYRQCIGG